LNHFHRLVLLALLLCPFVACTQDFSQVSPPPPPDVPVPPNDYQDEEAMGTAVVEASAFDWGELEPVVLADEVVLPEDHPCFDSAIPSANELILTTSCAADELDIEPGDLVIGASGGGYLARVLAVTTEAGAAHLTTEPATLDDAIVSGSFRATLSWPATGREVLDLSGQSIATGPTMSVALDQASVALKPTVFVGGSFGEDGTQVAEAVVSLYSHTNLQLLASTTAATSGSGSSGLVHTFLPYAFAIPAADGRSVPVAGTLVLRIDGVFEVETSAAMEATGTLDMVGSAELGQRWYGAGWSPVEEREMELETTAGSVTVAGGGRFKVQLRIRAELQLSGMSGPIFSLGPYFQLDAGEDCEQINYQLEGGFELGAFIDLRSLAEGLVGNYGPWSRRDEFVEGSVPNEEPPRHCEEEDPAPEPEPEPEPESEPESEPDPGPDADVEPEPESTSTPEEGMDDSDQACAPVASIQCGQTVSGNTSTDPQATSAMAAYPINVGNYAAPELVYEWTGGASAVEISMPGARPTEVNHDIMVLDGSDGTCNAIHAVDWGFSSLNFEPEGPGPFYIVVDGYYLDEGAFELRLECD